MGLNFISQIPTAWDYKFSSFDERRWVLVTLKDGGSVAGQFGGASFASSEPDERDIYIQKVYRVKQGQPWEPIESNDGILIRGDEIRYIEFWYD